MSQNIEEKELTIKWLMQDDKIVKFQEIDDTFDISDPVADFDFERAGVKTGTKVKVKIDKDQGDHGTVVFMAKSKNTESSNSSQSSSDNAIIKTVKAYGQKWSGSLLFTDNDKEWYTCDKSIGVDNLPQYKDKTVEITEGLTSKNKKVVKTIKIVEGQSSSKSSASSSGSSKNDFSKSEPRQVSIEAQACMNHANITVATLFAGKFDANKKEDGDLVKALIQSITKKNWEIVQELKKNA